MSTTVARATTTANYRLGEGPVWDAPRERLLWVDILAGLVLEGELVLPPGIETGIETGVDTRDETGIDVRETARHSFDGMVGAVVPADDGNLLVAGQEALVVQGPDGVRHPGPRIVDAGSLRRTNDGVVDPAGRFLIGTLSLHESRSDGENSSDDKNSSDHEHRSDMESLVCVASDGTLTVIDDDLGLSNGLAFSPDGSVLYSTDSHAATIYARHRDPATGTFGERRVHLVVDGTPDGICTDTAGGLWVAIWGGGEVRRYDGTGTITDTVTVAAPHTTSVAFVGSSPGVLLITTALTQLTRAQVAEFPDSGRLFTARVDYTGVPTTAWSGSASSTTAWSGSASSGTA